MTDSVRKMSVRRRMRADDGRWIGRRRLRLATAKWRRRKMQKTQGASLAGSVILIVAASRTPHTEVSIFTSVTCRRNEGWTHCGPSELTKKSYYADTVSISCICVYWNVCVCVQCLPFKLYLLISYYLIIRYIIILYYYIVLLLSILTYLYLYFTLVRGYRYTYKIYFKFSCAIFCDMSFLTSHTFNVKYFLRLLKSYCWPCRQALIAF